MDNSKMAPLVCPTWSLQLLEGWQGQIDESCVTVSSGQDIGVLQMSAAIKPTQVTDADLYDFAFEPIREGAKTKEVKFGAFVGFEFMFSVDNDFFRVWFLRHERQVLFVTYICDTKQRGVEDDDIQKMLATLMPNAL